MLFGSIVIGFGLVIWGEEERKGGEGSEVGSRWEFWEPRASGGMSCADWSTGILHRQKFITLLQPLSKWSSPLSSPSASLHSTRRIVPFIKQPRRSLHSTRSGIGKYE